MHEPKVVRRRGGTREEKSMAYDEGLVQRVGDLLHELGERGMRQKGVFGGRGFLRGKNTFLIVWGDGLLVKTTKAEYPRAVALAGVTPFAPDGENPMSTWLVVAAEQVAEDPELREWIRRGLESLSR
jgi:TfoX/Sxy family transcriptional regulator of competence genes